MKLKLLLFSSLALGFGLTTNAQEQQFTTDGSHSFTVPESVIGLRVECIGAGGAGGRVDPSNVFDTDAAGGGGGGAYARSIVSVSEDSTYNLVVGKGGTNTSSTNIHGGDSYFSDTLVLAEGGLTRTGNDNESGVNGGQATNSIGDITYSGGKGGDGDESDADGGGGGGAAGSTGNGSNGGNITAGGNTTSYGGAGGRGGADGASGQAGNSYGGGGGGSSANGSSSRNGGAGADGFVVVKWAAIDTIHPSLVCATANETVTIEGSNFTVVDSVLLNGQHVLFTLINTTTIELVIDSSLHSGRVIVYTENGISQTDTLTITRNSVSLSNDLNSLEATYTGDSLAANWYWYNCVSNDTVNTDSIGSFTASELGVYGVYVEENACVVQSACVVVNELAVVTPTDTTSTTGIRDAINNDAINLYPNPTSGKITIEANTNNSIQDVNIFDIKGSLVLHQSAKNQQKTTINISHLNAGVYIVKIITDNNKSINKLVKK